MMFNSLQYQSIGFLLTIAIYFQFWYTKTIFGGGSTKLPENGCVIISNYVFVCLFALGESANNVKN